jgi:signal transduction histidine kinase
MGGAEGVEAGAAVRRPHPRWLNGWLLSSWSIPSLMAGLILVVVVPLLAFSGFLVLRSAQHEQALMGEAVRERAQAAAATIDYDLSLLRAHLFILAGARSLQNGDLAAFHAYASNFARDDGLHVSLYDVTGRELVNTGIPYGHPSPAAADVEAIRQVAATGRPNVSDLAGGPNGDELSITVNVPVMRDGTPVYVLTYDITPLIPTLLEQLNLPPGWVLALTDDRGYVLARNRDVDHIVGRKGRDEINQHFFESEDGWFPSISREGVPIYNAFTHTRLAGWAVDIGIPDKVLFAPVLHSTLVLALVGGVAVCVALILASFIARRVSISIAGLVSYADAVGRSERLPPHPPGIKEIDAVACSLDQAAEQLHRSAEARDQAARELRESEQKYRELSEALAAANEERTHLLHQIVTAQEMERTRIARELHDRLGQYLAALLLGLDAIAPTCAASPTARQRLTELRKLTTELGRDFSRMAWELRPMALDELGLRNAITQYLEEWAELSGLHIDLEITLGDRRLPPNVETALFRVLQEAITNVVKHAGADSVGVILESIDGEIRLIIEDNGQGFQTDQGAAVALGKSHLGLLGVRERLALVNGRLEVESTPGSGTTVYACVPVAEGMDE